MKHMVRGFVCLAFAAVAAFSEGADYERIERADGFIAIVYSNAVKTAYAVPEDIVFVRALLVGGGGGGGNSMAGGGGGGEVAEATFDMLVNAGEQIAITVGDGGSGSGSQSSKGGTGNPSSIIFRDNTYSAKGGGGGGSWYSGEGASGACGGGGCNGKGGGAGTVGGAGAKSLGSDSRSGGGGGMGHAGYEAVGDHAGYGGEGVSNNITGVMVGYGGGGGGGGSASGNLTKLAGLGADGGGNGGRGENGFPGKPGTGGGGGGGGWTAGPRNGGKGGAGTVILLFRPLGAGDLELTAPTAAEKFENGASIESAVMGLGAGATSVDITFDYGQTPNSLGKSFVVTNGMTKACAIHFFVDRLQAGATYFGKLVAQNNKGESYETAVVSFTLPLCRTAKVPEEEGYKQLSYLKSTGSQYIILDFVPDGTTTFDLYCNLGSGGESALFGQTWAANNYMLCKQGNDLKFYGAGTRVGPYTANADAHITMDDAGKVTATVNGVAGTPTSVNRACTGGSLNVFATSGGSKGTSISLYSLSFKKGGSTACELYPARNPFGEVGLWDRTRKRFFTNAGSGAFQYGEIKEIGVTENVESKVLKSVSLTFDAAETARKLYVCSGAISGVADTSAWERVEFVADVDAAATAATYTVPATWGDDDRAIMRFVLEDDEVWSRDIVWSDYTTPVFGPFVSDGTFGDTILLNGSLMYTPGTCELVVFTGDSAETMTNRWSGLAGSTLSDAGAFSLSLCESDPTSPRHWTCGDTVYACVEATAGGKTIRSATVAAKTRGAAALSGVTWSVSRRTVTCKGTVSDAGAATNAALTVWAGKSNDPELFEQVGEAVYVTKDGTSFSIVRQLPDFETTYYCQLRATATPAGGTTNFVTVSGVQSVTTLDTTTYTWNGGASGSWTDRANWTDNQQGDSLGYPQSASATVSIGAGTTAVLTNAALTVGAFTMDGGMLVVSGGGTILSVSGVPTVKGGAQLLVEKGATVTFSSQNEFKLNGSSIIIDDATVNAGNHVFAGSDPGASITFKGQHPLWKQTHNAGKFCATGEGALRIDFEVPAGGFTEAPLKTTYTGNNTPKLGEGTTAYPFPVNVLKSSPILRQSGRIREPTPLISWNGGINTNKVVEGTLPSGPQSGESFIWGSGDFPKTLNVKLVRQTGIMLIVR